jgi:DNA-binding MarR family transcriptional regulator
MDDFTELLREGKWAILREIALEPSSATEIAESLKTSTSNITQQLKILEAYKFVTKEKNKEKNIGKPKIIYSLNQESAYVAVLSNGMAEKSNIKLDGFNKSLFSIIMLAPDDAFFILKFMFKNEELLKKCKGIAYLRSTREAVELFLLTDHVDEIRSKFSNLFIEDINGKTKKIINWTHSEFEIKDGLNRKDKYFMDMLKNIRVIHDPHQILINSIEYRSSL